MNTHDTIVALATAPLPAGVAILRLSGTAAWEAATLLTDKLAKAKPRQAVFSKLVHNGVHLDDALILGFKSPNSFTGEDVVEFHCHGSMAVVESVLQALLSHPKVRMAEAGEFTRRALEHGKLDLTAAEGLADLIAATTQAQQQQALKQLQGELGGLFETYRQEILHIVAHVEASLDFPDEELDILADERVKERIDGVLAKINASLASHAGERVRNGFKLAIIGKPNAGKSTLTNLLTGQDTAIVSNIAGTTRDVVQAQLNIAGFPVTLADTAGLRTQTSDTIERMGIQKATEQAKQADIILAVMDAADWPHIPQAIAPYLQAKNSLIILTKLDMTELEVPHIYTQGEEDIPVLGVNLLENDALTRLLPVLEDMIKRQYHVQEDAALLTRQRHRTSVSQAKIFLEQALNVFENPRPETSLAELLAQDLRNAAAAIGEVTGKTSSEDVLDLVFSTFCIGK